MLVVGVALVVSSFVALHLLRTSLTEGVREAAEGRAEEVASSVAATGLLPAPRAEDGEELLQRLDGDGRVLDASPGVDPAVGLGDVDEVRLEVPVGDESHFVVVQEDVPEPPGGSVVVAHTLEDVDESVGALAGLLAVGVPLLLLVIGVTTWFVIGRALAPVEALRRGVEEISAEALDRRLPTPVVQDEVARLADTMNRMLDRLEAAQVRQRRFVSDASHELRSPVATIRHHAEVALAHPERTSLPELAQTVLAEDLRVQQLVEDLLLLARSDEGLLRGARDEVDLDDLVLEEARRLRGAGPHRVDTTGVGAARTIGDAAQLARVVRNLGDNAVRHARSAIALSVGAADGQVVLTVDDDGAGIAETERARVFERFVRLDEDRSRDGGGAGLGLAIVAELAARHGGSVAVSVAPLGGARVEVRLPRAPG